MTFEVELVKTADGYLASCPDLPGCASQGKNEEEALENIQRVLCTYLTWKQNDQEAKQVRFIEIPTAEANKLQQQRKARGPFQVTPFNVNLSTEWTSAKTGDLLDLLDSSDLTC